jgi:hypothetical protein
MGEMEKALLQVVNGHAFLTWRGFETGAVGAEFQDLRKAWPNHIGEFRRALDWLQCVPPRLTVNRDFDSYRLKHAAEHWAGGYVSNGALIAAALHLGFVVEPIAGSLNAYISVSGETKWPKS